MGAFTETITWHDPAEEMPDDDIIVLVITVKEEEPMVAFHDGDTWREADGYPLNFDEVLRWAHLPIGQPPQPAIQA